MVYFQPTANPPYGRFELPYSENVARGHRSASNSRHCPSKEPQFHVGTCSNRGSLCVDAVSCPPQSVRRVSVRTSSMRPRHRHLAFAGLQEMATIDAECVSPLSRSRPPAHWLRRPAAQRLHRLNRRGSLPTQPMACRELDARGRVHKTCGVALPNQISGVAR